MRPLPCEQWIISQSEVVAILRLDQVSSGGGWSRGASFLEMRNKILFVSLFSFFAIVRGNNGE